MVNSSSNSNETLKTRGTPKSELKTIKGNSESRSNSSTSSSSSTSSPRNLKKSLSSTSLNPSQSGIPVIPTPKSQIARHHERIGGAKSGSISPSGIPRAQQNSTPTSSSSSTNSNNRSINKQNESKSNGNHHQLQSQFQFQSKPSATPSPTTNSIQLPKSNTPTITSPSSLPLYSRPPISPNGQPQSLPSSSFNFSANSSSSSNLAYQSPSRLPIASNLPTSSTDYSKLNTPKSSQFKPRVSTDTKSTPAKNIEYGFSGGNEQRQLFAGGSNVSNSTTTPTAPGEFDVASRVVRRTSIERVHMKEWALERAADAENLPFDPTSPSLQLVDLDLPLQLAPMDQERSPQILLSRPRTWMEAD